MQQSAKLLCFVATVALLAVATHATGCGEPLLDPHQNTCSEWQCSRNVSGFCVRGVAKNESCMSNADCYLDLDCIIAEHETQGTCQKQAAASKEVGIGLVGAFLGVLCFGSSFVPIKKYKKFAGDGVFAQFCMNLGRFFVGAIILFTRENRWFYWEAALGGGLWCLGNAMGVPIVQCIGIGLGVSIWGSTNMLLGWASGHFGIWGVKKEIADRPYLEYMGVAFSFVSIFLFLFVKPVPQMQKTPATTTQDDQDEEARKKQQHLLLSKDGQQQQHDDSNAALEKIALLDVNNMPTNNGTAATTPAAKQSLADTIGPKTARIAGVSMALVAGCLFGMCMDPAQKMMSHYDSLTLDEDVKYTPYGLDYVFSNNVGALLTSFTLLVIHSTLKAFGHMPTEKYFDKVEHAKLLLPAFAAGAIGACGSAAWFFANQNLGLIVSFPIVAAGPGVVSSLWGAFVFKEISGWRNFTALGIAFAFVVAAGVCSSLSKS